MVICTRDLVEIEKHRGKAVIGGKLDVLYQGGSSDLEGIIYKNAHGKFSVQICKDRSVVLTATHLEPRGAFKKPIPHTCFLRIEESDINFILASNDKKTIETIKGRSVLKRGLVGAVVLGPVGAIVGGMSGVKDKKKQKSFVSNMYVLNYTDNDGTIQEIEFSAEGVDMSSNMSITTFSNVFRQVFPQKCYYNEVPQFVLNQYKKEEVVEAAEAEKTVVHDPYEQLKKLKELLDLGIVTVEEFEEKKKQLLNM